MAGREPPRGPELDDWFAEPEPATSSTPPAEDDWLADRPPREPERRFTGSIERRRAALVGVIALALLLIGLAVGGVFSGGGSPTAPTTATTSTQTTTTQPTTTTTTTAPTPVRAPTTTLKSGDSGAEVKALQRALVFLGYKAGKVDGSYGPTTTAAVTDFQRASGLTADGIFGPQTLKALTTALAKKG